MGCHCSFLSFIPFADDAMGTIGAYEWEGAPK